jgi:hypothetical protein
MVTKRLPEIADHIIWRPDTPWLLSPVTAVIPLQFARLSHRCPARVGWSISREI